MAYKGFRPDLLTRIQNAILAGKMPDRVFNSREIGGLFGAPAWQVLECFARLVGIGYLRPLNGPDSGDGPKRSRAFKNKPRKPNPEEAQYEIPFEHWMPRIDYVPPKRPEGQKCPKCGQLVKRRHQRGKFHDPDKCLKTMVEDIHNM